MGPLSAKVIDGFFEDPALELQTALDQKYVAVEHNGLFYEGICRTHDLNSINKIEKIVGCGFQTSTCMWRQYLPHYESKTWIHSDILIASFTAIVFLTPPELCHGGVAFWKHKALGWEAHPSKEVCESLGIYDDDYFKQIYKDGFNEAMWEMVDYVPMYNNRAVIFQGGKYHSRYPQKDTSSRLIKVFFCKI
jgi:hypothetical protein